MTEQKDFLIISYNEAKESFEKNDCIEVIDKVKNERPIIIFVCTQESNSSFGSKSHYQHILGKELLELEYKLLIKYDGSVGSSKHTSFFSTIKKIGLKTIDKNIRVRVYYNIKSILNNINTINSPISTKNNVDNEVYEYKDENNYNYLKSLPLYNSSSPKFYIRKIQFMKSEILGKSKTIFKGSYYLYLELEDRNKKRFKMIVVNSHLYFTGKISNTGLSQRTNEFLSLIDESKLDQHYKNGVNIFFCGDLNFRLTSNILNKISRENPLYKEKSKEISEKIIEYF